MTTVRARFAPSPTGFLHLGSARTALFAWAFARRHRGTFILRIEDTDVERSTQEAVQAIFDAMSWLGLDYDEGPFFQMQRMDRYRAVIDEMLARGIAANGLTPPPGVKPVVRFRNPDEGSVVWNDAVKGTIEIANAELDDLVVARSDGTPTYNFCVVVDDLDMRITHVVRGDDHVNNTPRQINMILALGAAVPSYAHLPTVLGDDGHKLSKRHGAVSVMQYEEEGFLPEALINFLARLGWAHGDDEVFTRDELVAWFDIAHVNPAPARFDADKLRWLNHEHMKRLAADELGRRLQPFLERAGLDLANGPPVEEVAMLLRDRTPTLVEMADAAHYFYATPHVPAEKLAEFVTAGNRPALVELYEAFATLPWSRESIGAALKSGATKHGLKPPQIMMALRMIVTGTRETPAIDAVLAPLGRDATRARMKARLEL